MSIDPLYTEFVRAMSKLAEEDRDKSKWTKAQKEARKQIALRILKELRAEGDWET